MLEVKEFEGITRYTKTGTLIERLRATKYLRKVEREITYAESEKKALESRLKFLYEQREEALHFRLMH